MLLTWLIPTKISEGDAAKYFPRRTRLSDSAVGVFVCIGVAISQIPLLFSASSPTNERRGGNEIYTHQRRCSYSRNYSLSKPQLPFWRTQRYWCPTTHLRYRYRASNGRIYFQEASLANRRRLEKEGSAQIMAKLPQDALFERLNLRI